MSKHTYTAAVVNQVNFYQDDDNEDIFWDRTDKADWMKSTVSIGKWFDGRKFFNSTHHVKCFKVMTFGEKLRNRQLGNRKSQRVHRENAWVCDSCERSNSCNKTGQIRVNSNIYDIIGNNGRFYEFGLNYLLG